MKIVNIQAAKTHLSRLVEEVVAGEEVILAKAGRPMVRLIAFQPASKTRILGALRGRVEESPDCWEPDRSLEKEFTENDVIPPLHHSDPSGK